MDAEASISDSPHIDTEVMVGLYWYGRKRQRSAVMYPESDFVTDEVGQSNMDTEASISDSPHIDAEVMVDLSGYSRSKCKSFGLNT